MFGRWTSARTVLPWVVLAVSLLGLVVYAFPGYMSIDSFNQLMEGRSGIRSDMHPPLMAVEWSVLDAFVSGPLLMLLLQGCLMLFGTFTIVRTVVAPPRAAAVALAVLWFPPVLTTFGVIWKDAQMAAYLLTGIACLISERRAVRIIGLLAMTVACGLRFNAAAAVMPAVTLLFVWSPGKRWWVRYSISLTAAIAITFVAFTTNRLLTVNHVQGSPAVYDIVGVISHCEPLDDASLRETLRGCGLVSETGIQARARQIFRDRNPFWYDVGPDRMFDRATDDAGRAALERAWHEIVRAHFRAYLTYRWLVFRQLIGDTHHSLSDPVWTGTYADGVQPRVIEHSASRSRIQVWLAGRLETLAYKTALFVPLVYLWIGLLVLALFARDRLSISLLASGLLYEAAYFPVVQTPDFRYSHWMIVSIVVATVLVFVRRASRQTGMTS